MTPERELIGVVEMVNKWWDWDEDESTSGLFEVLLLKISTVAFLFSLHRHRKGGGGGAGSSVAWTNPWQGSIPDLGQWTNRIQVPKQLPSRSTPAQLCLLRITSWAERAVGKGHTGGSEETPSRQQEDSSQDAFLLVIRSFINISLLTDRFHCQLTLNVTVILLRSFSPSWSINDQISTNTLIKNSMKAIINALKCCLIKNYFGMKN